MYCINWKKLEFVGLSTSIYIIQFPLKIGENGVFFTRDGLKYNHEFSSPMNNLI